MKTQRYKAIYEPHKSFKRQVTIQFQMTDGAWQRFKANIKANTNFQAFWLLNSVLLDLFSSLLLFSLISHKNFNVQNLLHIMNDVFNAAAIVNDCWVSYFQGLHWTNIYVHSLPCVDLSSLADLLLHAISFAAITLLIYLLVKLWFTCSSLYNNFTSKVECTDYILLSAIDNIPP